MFFSENKSTTKQKHPVSKTHIICGKCALTTGVVLRVGWEATDTFRAELWLHYVWGEAASCTHGCSESVWMCRSLTLMFPRESPLNPSPPLTFPLLWLSAMEGLIKNTCERAGTSCSLKAALCRLQLQELIHLQALCSGIKSWAHKYVRDKNNKTLKLLWA